MTASPRVERPSRVVLCECAARDGLQHEPDFVPTDRKIALIRRFADIGFTRVEVTSFSHPEHVPQFRDALDVLRGVADLEGVSRKATCVNLVAVQRAVAARRDGIGPDEISLVVSASETHAVRTTNRTHAQLRDELAAGFALANGAGLRATGTIGTAFGCPFTGPVSDGQVIEWVGFFTELGADLVSLGDTTGMADPWLVGRRFRMLSLRFPDVAWSAHFHDTRGLALANCVAAVDAGVDHLDSSFGGLGGHPAGRAYAKGHTGNASTEDLVALLETAGIDTGIDVDRLLDTSRTMEEIIGRQLESRVARAGLTTDLFDEESAEVGARDHTETASASRWRKGEE